MEIVGPVAIKINGRFAITVTNFSRDVSTPTKVHKGAFGPFGNSEGISDVTGSFKVSIPKTGLEFKFSKEFAGEGATLVAQGLASLFKEGYTKVKVNKDSLSVDQAAGNTEVSIGWTAQERVEL